MFLKMAVDFMMVIPYDYATIGSQENFMGQVFTSYSRRDTETVDNIVGKLSQAGMSIWIDREAIKAGNSWRVQIVRAIDTCDAFVLMLSGNSAASDNVRKEIDLAQDSGRIIFAILLEPVKLPAEIRYQLAGLQFIDIQMLGFDKGVNELIEVLKEHLKKIEPVEEPSTRQTELVIQGVDLSAFDAEKQEQLLAFISSLTNADRSQLKIENMTAGSVHVFVDMPSEAAFELKTLALNRDKRLKKFGIASLRLNGDNKFINVQLGKPMLAATIGPIMVAWLKMPALFPSLFGAAVGKALTVLVIAATVAGVGILLPANFVPVPITSQTPTILPTSVPASTSSLEPEVTSTATETHTSTPTSTNTSTPTLTATVTLTPTPTYLILTGIVTSTVSNRIACRFGPGDDYLYRFSLLNGYKMEIRGQVEVRSGRELGAWLWGLAEGFPDPCWVNAKYIQLDGDVASLETVYPGKVELPLTTTWPEPQNVIVARLGDRVSIIWDEYLLPLGEREGEQSPRYLAELWLCQTGKLAFTPIGTLDPGLVVRDEAGCAEPSHGRLYLAEKHGYVGPVEIQWPPHTTPTP
jgi:hypothetical protein